MMLLRGLGRQVRTVIRAASQPHSCFTVRQLKEDCVIPGPCLPNLLCISNRALYGYILLPVATQSKYCRELSTVLCSNRDVPFWEAGAEESSAQQWKSPLHLLR